MNSTDMHIKGSGVRLNTNIHSRPKTVGNMPLFYMFRQEKKCKVISDKHVEAYTVALYKNIYGNMTFIKQAGYIE